MAWTIDDFVCDDDDVYDEEEKEIGDNNDYDIISRPTKETQFVGVTALLLIIFRYISLGLDFHSSLTQLCLLIIIIIIINKSPKQQFYELFVQSSSPSNVKLQDKHQ